MEHARSGSAGGRTCSEPQSKKQAESGKEVGVKLNADESFRNKHQNFEATDPTTIRIAQSLELIILF
jgi:hypothetical protein